MRGYFYGLTLLLVLLGAAGGFFLKTYFLPEPPAVLAPDAATAEAVSFLAVGRQGYDNPPGRRVAAGMERVAAGRPQHFVVLGGDNFFRNGVASVDDPQWGVKFETLYGGRHLRGTPFYATLGNHDHLGNAEAQVRYAQERRGSARWRMNGRYYRRDFGRAPDGRTLVRVVFLDMIPMLESADEAEAQTAFLRESFADGPGETGGPVWKVLVGHNPLQSLTAQPTALTRVMHDLRPIAVELGVDLALSSNDWFQQLLDRDGEPIYVSTSGGGRKLEPVETRSGPREFTLARHGFAGVTAEAGRLTVTLYDADGEAGFTATRERGTVRGSGPQ
ncbi:MAG: metallophosphoesterase [Planctomycetota bacterium]